MRFKPQDVLGEKSSCGIMSPSRPLSLRWTKEAIDEIQRHKGTPLLNKGVKDALEAASRVKKALSLPGSQILSIGLDVELCTVQPVSVGSVHHHEGWRCLQWRDHRELCL